MSNLITERIDDLRRIVGGPTRCSTGHHQASVVAVAARKGGVGKTTSAVNMAAEIALRGQKVLLVDMDAQGHCGSALHAVLRGATGESMSTILLGKRRDLHEIALPTAIGGLWATPSDKDLASTEGIMAGRIGKEFMLRSVLKVARTHYDAIVIDCPPNLGTLTVNALVAADWLLVPCGMSVLALEGVEDILQTIDTLDETLGSAPSVLGVFRTRFDGRNQKVNDAVDRTLDERYAHLLLDTRIPVNTRLAQAQADGVPIMNFDPQCRGAIAYRALVDEIGPRIGI